MRTDIPTPIRNTLHDLEADALVELFKIELRDGTLFHLGNYGEVSWQGMLFEDVPCNMTDMGRDASGKMTRPKFTFANPGGVFTSSLYKGKMDGAMVTRFRVLKGDLEADNNFKMTEAFRVSRVAFMSNSVATVELRDVLDGPFFRIPARTFRPPEFPHVKI